MVRPGTQAVVITHVLPGPFHHLAEWVIIMKGDFQRLRTNTDTAEAPLLAASIFFDVLNVFLFFLEIFSGDKR